MIKNKLHTIADAARILGVKYFTLYRRCNDSLCHCVRKGRRILLSDENIKEMRRYILYKNNAQLTFEDVYEFNNNTNLKDMKKPIPMPAGFTDLKEAGNLLGISYVAVSRLARQGVLRYKKRENGSIVVNYEDVKRLVDDGGVITGVQAANELGIERSSLAELCHVGLIAPIIKSPRCVIYKRADIERIKSEGRHYVCIHEASMRTGLDEETIRKIISPVVAKQGYAVYDLDKLREQARNVDNPGVDVAGAVSDNDTQLPHPKSSLVSATPTVCPPDGYISIGEAMESTGESRSFVIALAYSSFVRYKGGGGHGRLWVSREDIKRIVEEGKYIGRARVMSIMRVSPSILYALRNTGILPAVTTFKSCAIYNRADIEAFMKAGRHYMLLRDVAAAVGKNPTDIAGHAPSIKTSYGLVFYNLEEVREWVETHKDEAEAHITEGVVADGMDATPDKYVSIGEAATILGEDVAFVKSLMVYGAIKGSAGKEGRRKCIAREDIECGARDKKYIGKSQAMSILRLSQRVYDVLLRSGILQPLFKGRVGTVFERATIESIKAKGHRYMGLQETAREFGIKQNSLVKYGNPVASYKGTLVFDASHLVLQKPSKEDAPTNSGDVSMGEPMSDADCVDVWPYIPDTNE